MPKRLGVDFVFSITSLFSIFVILSFGYNFDMVSVNSSEVPFSNLVQLYMDFILIKMKYIFFYAFLFLFFFADLFAMMATTISTITRITQIMAEILLLRKPLEFDTTFDSPQLCCTIIFSIRI